MRWNSAGLARPVRTVLKSSFATSTALVMRSPASCSTSAITGDPSRHEALGVYRASPAVPLRAVDRAIVSASGGDEGADLGTADGGPEGVVALDAEHAHGHAVVHVEAERRRVDDLQPVAQRLGVGDRVE